MQRITRFFLLFVVVAIGTQLSAQATVGIRAGYANTQVASSDLLDVVTDQLDGLGTTEFSIFAELPISNGISFQPELGYTSRGFALGLTEDITLAGVPLPLGVRAKTRFNYVEAPLLIKAAFGNDKTQTYVMAGPSVGLATSGRIRTTARALVEIPLTNTPINLDAIDYQRLSVSGVAAIGVQHQLTSGVRVFGDVRYTHGFTNLYDIPVVQERLSHRAVGANVGLAFAL